MIARRRVDLPAPLRPTMVTTSPAATSSDTSLRARACPYQADRFSTLNIGVSQVGGHDARVAADLGVGAFGEDLAVAQHRDGVGEGADDVHVVLDEYDGAPFPDPRDQLDGAVDVLGAHPGGRFVEEQDAGFEGERERQFERAAAAVGEGVA